VVADVWQRNWDRVIPFFQFPAEVRKVIRQPAEGDEKSRLFSQ
jgi:transposase-like protein